MAVTILRFETKRELDGLVGLIRIRRMEVDVNADTGGAVRRATSALAACVTSTSGLGPALRRAPHHQGDRKRQLTPCASSSGAVQGSSPDNDGTSWYCQTERVRKARREGAREEPALHVEIAHPVNAPTDQPTTLPAVAVLGPRLVKPVRVDVIHAAAEAALPRSWGPFRRRVWTLLCTLARSGTDRCL